MNSQDMTPKQAAEYAHGANAFCDDFPKIWEIKTAAKSTLEELKPWIKQMKVDGFYVKRKSYSDFVHCIAVRKRILK